MATEEPKSAFPQGGHEDHGEKNSDEPPVARQRQGKLLLPHRIERFALGRPCAGTRGRARRICFLDRAGLNLRAFPRVPAQERRPEANPVVQQELVASVSRRAK